MKHDEDTDWNANHKAMIELLRLYQIKDTRILAAMGKVQRHRFIPSEYRRTATAYGDHPWPIGYDQTISQPFIVAHMTERLSISKGDKVLEIGTGSGYQAAILAELSARVFTIEIIPELAEHARMILNEEGYNQVQIRLGDGHQGWPEHSPYDSIIATCAPDSVPSALVDQLAEGGRMVIPVGSWLQRLVILRKTNGTIHQEDDIAVRFVPMVSFNTDTQT